MSPNGDTIEWRHGQAWSWAGAGPIRMGCATPAPTPTRLGPAIRIFEPALPDTQASDVSLAGNFGIALWDVKPRSRRAVRFPVAAFGTTTFCRGVPALLVAGLRTPIHVSALGPRLGAGHRPSPILDALAT